jgi:hypothetical protein
MFDVFYSGPKPNLFAFERPADSLEDAARKSRTGWYWFIYGLNDYSGFDFDYVPPPWQAHYTHVWADQHNSDGNVYLTQNPAADRHYHSDHPVHRLSMPECFHIPDHIDPSSVDLRWSPNPLDPAYIYHFPSQHQSASGVTYTVPGARTIKLVGDFRVRALPTTDNWYIPDRVSGVDLSWHPNPLDPAYIYHFPSQHQSASGVTYTVPGATDIRLTDDICVQAEPSSDNWHIPDGFDLVDLSWHPNPLDPAYIYHFPSQHQSASGVTYIVPGATDIRLTDDICVRSLPKQQNWHIPDNIVGVDLSWHPNPLDPAYIYHFPSQHQSASGVTYTVPGATDVRLSDSFTVKVLPSNNQECWHVPDHVDPATVDYSWHPNPFDPAYIYHFPSQHQSASGVTYTVPGATEIKLIDSFQVKALPRPDLFDNRDTVEWFDYSWHPNPLDPVYIHEFPTQWNPVGGPVYLQPNATEYRYHTEPVAQLKPTTDRWQTLLPVSSFDYSWTPHPKDPPYVYVFGNQHWPGTVMPTVTYTVPGAIEHKFVDLPAQLAPDRTNWEILEPIAEAEWDWSWRPDPKAPPYIYVFGNQWNPAEYRASVRYVVPGATEVKYMEARTRRLPRPGLFAVNIPVADFDWSWEPNPFDPPLTYVFGNQWNPSVLEPTVVYNAGGTEIKYMEEPVATVAQDTAAWELLDDIESFDYSWRPNPTDPPYIYVFGNQWMTPEQRPALRYVVPGATEIKYMDEPKARRRAAETRFVKRYPTVEFDWSWEPDPGSPPYHYVFGNQYYPAEVDPTIEFVVPGATEHKFMSEPVAKLTECRDSHWHTVVDCDWDYAWHPEPGSPPYIYVFGNQHWPAEKMPTVEYHMPGATERKYMLEPQAKLLPNRTCWSVPEEIDDTNIDFSWVPDPGAPAYIYHFGSNYQISTGLTYTVPGATEPRFEGMPPALRKERGTVKLVDIFYIDHGNDTATTRYELLRNQYPDMVKVRYANSIMDTIQRCVKRSRTSKFWVISSEYDYTDFDFAWHAQPWQSYMTHVFPSQHQKWSNTFLINRWEFERHSAWANSLEQFPNLNFVTDQQVVKKETPYTIYYVDHGNGMSQFQYDFLRSDRVAGADIVKTRFVDNYLDTFRRIMSTAETEYVWIINSVCDYQHFDFTWEPEPWQSEMIHVFPSDNQRRGDTFYIHVESFRKQMVDLDLLDWFNVINYCEDQRVSRWEIPTHSYESDNLVNEIKSYKFTEPYVMFTNQPDLKFGAAPCLWSEKDRVVQRCSRSGATCLVPAGIKRHLRTQIYDYPHLEESNLRIAEYYNTATGSRPGLDLVYISNGEPDEERWYEHACYASNRDVKWVRGINGRTAAYQEAARQSETPWFFAIFAKLELKLDFDWWWMPDYYQEPKHYIFNALNPLNGLEYGHQGMIAYNKNLVLSNNMPGIDFTLSQPHESVPMLSGTAHFNQDAWMTWRTAFREVVKLQHFVATDPTLETEHRLAVWLTQAEGNYSDYCLAGARDAVSFYEEVGGDYNLLLLSFEWAWLRARFDAKYKDAGQ